MYDPKFWQEWQISVNVLQIEKYTRKRNIIKSGEFERMRKKEELVDLLLDISDFLGLPTEMPEILDEIIWGRALTKYVPEIAQICLLIYVFKSCESQFQLRLKASSPWQE